MQLIEQTMNNNEDEPGSGLVDFISCLKNIDSRISSKKDRSQTTSARPIKAAFDKLKIDFKIPISRDKLLPLFKLHGFGYRHTYLNGRLPFIEVYKDHGSYWFPNYPNFSGFSTNPDKFINWDRFKEQTSTLFNMLENIDYKISRLDLALDFAGDFDELKNDLTIARIGSTNSFTVESYNSSKSSGIRYGKKPRQVELYDYSLKHSKKEKVVRLEERLFNKKVFIRKWQDLESIETYEVFKGVKFSKILLPKTLRSLNSQTIKLDSLISSIGYFEAKKVLNKQGNFGRDLEKFLVTAPYEESPELSFKKLIKTYLRPTQ